MPRHFRNPFLGFNTLLVAIAAAVIGAFLFLHWEHVTPAEIVLFVVLVFVLLPGVVYLLYRRFKHALEVASEAEAAASSEAEARQAELTNILEALIDPIVSIGVDGRVLTANPAVERVFGWSAGELIGQNVSVLMAEPYRSQHAMYLRDYLETGQPQAIGRIRKVIGLRRNGEEFPCELSVSRVDDPDGIRFVGVVRDISEREQMSSRLAQAERLAAVGELAAGVAHEVNNPVNTIINCAQLIRDGDDDPVLTSDIIDEGMRIASIVRDLLDFARDHGEMHSPTRIQDVIERTLSLVSHRIERQGIKIETDIDSAVPMIKGRSQQLQQVFLNLLLNARDALAQDAREHVKRIRIWAEAQGAGEAAVVNVHVRDNGPGIEAQNRDRIFQPFFTTKRGKGGTGLGLAVSLGIVRSHHGELSVSSIPGEFTDFTVTLPVDNGWTEESLGSDRSP